MIKEHFKTTKEHVKRVIRIEESAHSIATGFAVGTMLALLPTFGLGIFIGLAVIIIFKKISKISMIASFAFWNPILLIPMYTLSYKIGEKI